MSIVTRPTAVTLDATYGVNRRPGPIKKIERRAAAQSMRLRRTTSGTGMGAGDDDDYKRQHFVKQ
ncbi:hypothetical protein JYU34_018403 [Plutella xylostella]|uniref:Uncharacterized protein n=1 Tax=Plutella xylostella TaxID=51655 RepID=A0ABQ7PXH3_PLUXY|nr:hypothetical protein JYU34_018401 [Plutella xylostella]KAG7297685.1 hypothetical protein JYU34_018403 [Plutella xylostella]